MKKKLVGVCCILVILLGVSGLWAARALNLQEPDQMVREPESLAMGLTPREMAAKADLIAIGQCVNTRSQWVGRVLVTLADISVSEVLKGEPASTVTVALPGGVDANRKFPIAMSYPGAPTITPQEDVFLFLTGEPDVAGAYAVVGFAQGKFSIVEDDQGQKVVARDSSKPRLRPANGTAKSGARAVPLARFKSEIVDYLRQR